MRFANWYTNQSRMVEGPVAFFQFWKFVQFFLEFGEHCGRLVVESAT